MTAAPHTAPHVALLGPANSVHLQRWAWALQARGWRVSLLSQHWRDALALPPEVALVPLPHQGQSGYLRNAGPLRRWLQAQRPQLLHTHYASGYGSTAMLAGWQPALLSVWGSDVQEFPQRSPLHRWLLRRNLLAARAVTSTSQAMAVQVRELAPELQALSVVPFGVELQAFAAPAPTHTPDGTRAPGTLTIGTVKTLDGIYGIDLLLQAFALLQAQPPGPGAAALRLRIVGSGPQQAALLQLAQQLGIAQAVDFVGAVPHDQVPQELARMDIFVALSRRESFGVAVVEAGAAGLPALVSDVGGLPEVVRDGVTGLVVPGEQPQAAAAALARLVRDAALRARLGAAARAHVQQHYAWPACVQAMIALYQQHLPPPPPPGPEHRRTPA